MVNIYSEMRPVLRKYWSVSTEGWKLLKGSYLGVLWSGSVHWDTNNERQMFLTFGVQPFSIDITLAIPLS